ncbi:MAG: hypothetical protein GW947_04135, partial [Candidatus Pacebacteria bacterium]|nr:hypothetical protein [Candidatus Paceibacterota bacterium]
GLSDGSHTWKIVALDAEGNSAESATWSFNIDTLSPVFVITQVGNVTTSISSQDLDTIPDAALELDSDNPVLKGTGEANSSVILIIRLPDGTTKEETFDIDDQGTWSIQIKKLPRDQIIYLDFTITDRVGHISILENVPIIVKPLSMNIPGISEPVVIPTELEPLIAPILEPGKLIDETVIVPDDLDLPRSLKDFAQALPGFLVGPTTRAFQFSLAFLALIIALSLPSLKLGILLNRFRTHTTFNLLGDMLRVVGFWKHGYPQGIAIDSLEQTPVRFASVVFQGKTTGGRPHTVTKLTDKHGIYSRHKLTPGTYQTSFLQEEHLFPTMLKPDPGIDWQHYYRGREFEVPEEDKTPALCAVLDPITEEETKQATGDGVLEISNHNWPIGALVLIATLLAPTLWNLLAVVGFVFSYLNGREKKNKLELVISDEHGESLTYTVVMIHDDKNTYPIDLTQTDAAGIAKLTVPRDAEYVLTTIKHGFKLSSEPTHPESIKVSLPTHGKLQLSLTKIA